MKKEFLLLSVLASIGLVLYFFVFTKEDIVDQVENEINYQEDDNQVNKRTNTLEERFESFLLDNPEIILQSLKNYEKKKK